MKLKVLSIACQKGGSAKTTTGINLAVEAVARGLEVVYIDLDPQVSACDWKDIRGDKPPVVAATPVPHLDRALRAADEAGADLAIVDTAGRTNDAASAAARVADLILVPLQPSLIDLKTLNATLEIIRLAGSKPTRALLTRVRAAGNRHEDTTAWLEQQGVEVCPFVLGERVIYQDAYAQGLGVTEVEADGKAADEIRQVYLYASRLLGLSTNKRMTNEEGRSTRKRIA
jgi:chromosome partitioning protein